VVALQAGDEATIARWREIVAESEFAFREIYDRLGVLLEPDDSAGESTYNDQLADVIAELTTRGLAVESGGALVVLSQEIIGPDGDPVTLMVRKSDGGYGYDTTDLATIRHRLVDLKADRLLYVVDARQALHFRLVFEAARRAGWLTDGAEATHVAFGTVLGPGRPAVQDPLRRHGEADGPARHGHPQGAGHRRGEGSRSHGRRARPDR
jgi:arginyl-tRNA synthetase